jgi:hypothetical protein
MWEDERRRVGRNLERDKSSTWQTRGCQIIDENYDIRTLKRVLECPHSLLVIF